MKQLLGLLLGLSISLVAFEWRFYESVSKELAGLGENKEDVEELPPITMIEDKPPPPPPAPTTEIKVVEDTKEEQQEIASTEATAQTEVIPQTPPPPPPEEPVEEPQVFVVVEKMPEFPGGESALLAYLQANIKYPQYAREAGIQGIVYISFVVNEKGEVQDVTVLKGIGGGCDEEAVRVIKSLPKFKPGEQRGKPVKVRMNIPVRFTLK